MVKSNPGKIVVFLLIAALLILSGGCKQEVPPQSQKIITDHLGRQVSIPKEVKRVISSYYIPTSLLIALGVKEQIVGLEIMADTRPLYHRAAPELLRAPAVGSGKTFNIEECIKLKPDLVILPTRMKEYIQKLEQQNIAVIAIAPETLDSLLETIQMLGRAVNAEKRAGELREFYQEKIEKVGKLTAQAKRPGVYLTGASPLTTCTKEMYQHSLINLAGGTNVASEIEKGYWTNVSLEQVLKWDPEVILVVQYAGFKAGELKKNPQWQALSAVKNGRVLEFPSQLETWDTPGPAAILGILWLTHTLHPELYSRAELENDVRLFYQKFYNISVTDKELGAW